MKTQAFVCAWAMLVAVGCGEVSSNKKPDAGTDPDGDVAPPADFTIALDQTSLESTISGTASVNVTITRGEGFTDAVALTVTGLPSGVTGTFGADSLPEGMDTTGLTLAVDTAASVGTTTITVTGKAGALEHTATVSLELQTVTVAGTVRGAPAASSQGVTVRIVGKSAVVSDSTGAFSFTDVKLPYDIYVIGTTGIVGTSSIPTVYYYKGLTRLDPVVTKPTQTFFGIIGTLGSNGDIVGSRSGAGNTTNPMYVAWSSGGSQTTTNSYNFKGFWSPMAASKTGTLYALQPTRAAANVASPPTGFAYKAQPGTINANQTNNFGIILEALATTAGITGTITQPAGFPTPTLTMVQQVGGTQFDIWVAATNSAASQMPLLAGQKTSFHATSTLSGRQTQVVFPGLTAATDVNYTLPPPAAVTGPVNNATNVTTTTPFEFTTSENQLYEVAFNNGTATFVVYTTSGSVTIPNVSEMPLPSNADYTWRVNGYGPHASVNGAADPTNIEGVVKGDLDGPIHTFTSVPDRDFTTAP